ncbi:NAD(P)H-dependent glycerol-3-phosphate dehydrogenase [Roseobacter weihaiensis]|uniref:NAD(P)H-dependent glycerol-3-phosphate dehydrogenase n=1 Tax=Roseobacter weihaiensis TaxID=2763262 RepID=UPI001D0B5780|nr:NAD(P)H-dependent glycerol-3-phosphate dehydrogenase [Roseobacter sp. H9]
MSLGVLGAGAFGTALAITLSQKGPMTLWARDPAQAHQMARDRTNAARLPGVALPDRLTVTSDLTDLDALDTVLVAVPLQKLRAFLEEARRPLTGKTLVACCKGMELRTGLGPLEIMAEVCPESPRALLTGPSFARDIAQGLPTALTLACTDEDQCIALQQALSNNTLRLYRTGDVIGAALGGALKNVIAIACGAAIGAGLGESARAALMTRGHAEMQRLAAHKGADPTTLFGLSGFGDLVLTATSAQSRNYRFGLSIGTGAAFDPAATVEGAATAQAVAAYAKAQGIDLPISSAVAALVEKRLDVEDAMTALLSRSLKEE